MSREIINQLSASINLDQYWKLKENKIGDKIAIIDYWDENDNDKDCINKNIFLYFADFVIKTKVLNQLINTESKLPTYEIRDKYRDEPEYHELTDDPYQSIELEILEFIIPKNNEHINEQARLEYMMSKDYATYLMTKNMKFTYA